MQKTVSLDTIRPSINMDAEPTLGLYVVVERQTLIPFQKWSNLPKVMIDHFNSITYGGLVLCGRKAFEELPRIEVDREYVVLTSRDPMYVLRDEDAQDLSRISVVHSWEEALKISNSKPHRKTWVVGDADVQEHALRRKMCDVLWVIRLGEPDPDDTLGTLEQSLFSYRKSWTSYHIHPTEPDKLMTVEFWVQK